MHIKDMRIDLPSPKYKVEQVIEKKKHSYRITHADGKIEVFGGVTSALSIIAKNALIPWATKMGIESMANAIRNYKNTKAEITDEWIESITKEAKVKPENIKNEAADIGTQAHAWFESFIQGKELDITDKIKPAVFAFKQWMKQSKLSIAHGDTKVASIRYGYGGALDALAVDEDEQWVLLDWKTSNGIYDEYALQVSAYVQAFEETYNVTPRRAIIIRFSKKEPVEFEVKEVSNINKSLQAFLFAKNLQESMQTSHFRP